MCEVYSIMLIFLCAVLVLAGLFQSWPSKGSTDVLMILNQVSWWTRSMFRSMFRFRWLVR